MPTYTYKCTQCQMQFDSFQSIADPPLQACPSCHGELKRIITGGAGLIFKGSGFYITDYARKNTPKETSHASKKKASENKKESKSDS